MTIPNYSGETCVAFIDISGFRNMMERGIKAERALDKFYNTVFRTAKTREFNSKESNLPKIRSLVVSDCAVVFVDNSRLRKNKMRDLSLLLRFIQNVNRTLIASYSNPSIMTTCSIDYGRFKYQDRIEFEGIGKDYFYGEPYVNAFLDNERLKRKPGHCRVLRKNLKILQIHRQDFPFSLLKREGNYNYFYWMLDNLDGFALFKREYEGLSQSVYTGMISLLKRFSRTQKPSQGLP